MRVCENTTNIVTSAQILHYCTVVIPHQSGNENVQPLININKD